jgi:hypothetical protein
MTTNPNLESIGVSLIDNPTRPTDYNAGRVKDERRLHRIEAKELREFNQPMVDATENTKMELKDTLNNRDAEIIKALRNCKNISPEEARHVPYVDYRYAA